MKRILFLSLLIAPTLAHGGWLDSLKQDRPYSEFMGIKLGISKGEFFAEMKKRGFEIISVQKAAELARSGANKKKVCVDDDNAAEGFQGYSNPFCIEEKGVLNGINALFYKDRMFALDLDFSLAKAEESYAGIVGKFGSDFFEMPFSYDPARDPRMGLTVCPTKNCKVIAWAKKGVPTDAQLTAYEPGTLHGKAARLSLADNDIRDEWKKAFLKFRADSNRATASKLGF
jgi:hypothetical protein